MHFTTSDLRIANAVSFFQFDNFCHFEVWLASVQNGNFAFLMAQMLVCVQTGNLPFLSFFEKLVDVLGDSFTPFAFLSSL